MSTILLFPFLLIFWGSYSITEEACPIFFRSFVSSVFTVIISDWPTCWSKLGSSLSSMGTTFWFSVRARMSLLIFLGSWISKNSCICALMSSFVGISPWILGCLWYDAVDLLVLMNSAFVIVGLGTWQTYFSSLIKLTGDEMNSRQSCLNNYGNSKCESF